MSKYTVYIIGELVERSCALTAGTAARAASRERRIECRSAQDNWIHAMGGAAGLIATWYCDVHIMGKFVFNSFTVFPWSFVTFSSLRA